MFRTKLKKPFFLLHTFIVLWIHNWGQEVVVEALCYEPEGRGFEIR
jgi:hypothetical protein